MNNFLNYIKTNSVAFIFFAVALIFGAVTLSCNGLKVSDYVKVSVPKEIQQGISVPREITLTQSADAWEDWVKYVKAEGERLKTATDRFDRSISDGEKTYSFIFSLVNTGLSSPEAAAVKDSVSILPGGALVLGGLTTLGALFMPAPGTSKRLKEAEDKGWDDGHQTGLQKVKVA